MDEMTIENAIYIQSFGSNSGVLATIDGVEMSVPLDPNNRHYAEILRQVESGNLTIADAES